MNSYKPQAQFSGKDCMYVDNIIVHVMAVLRDVFVQYILRMIL